MEIVTQIAGVSLPFKQPMIQRTQTIQVIQVIQMTQVRQTSLVNNAH